MFSKDTQDKIGFKIKSKTNPVKLKRYKIVELAGGAIPADFAFMNSGDSMAGAGICDGDTVFIRQQDVFENGDIVAVIYEGEVFLRYIHYWWGERELALYSANGKYEPMFFIEDQIDYLMILGKVVAFRHDLP